MANKKVALTSVQTTAEDTLTPEMRKQAKFSREEFAEADAHGDTSEGLSGARMKRDVPVRGLEALLKHEAMTQDLIMAANHYHADLMAAESIGSAEVKERVDTSGNPLGQAEYLADCRMRLGAVRKEMGGTADLIIRLDALKRADLIDQDRNEERIKIEAIFQTREVQMRFIDAVFTHHPHKRLSAIYGKGRPYRTKKEVGIQALIRLSEIYGFRAH